MKIKVEFEMGIIDGVSENDIQKWLEFVLGYTGGMPSDSPLVDTELSANYVSLNID